MNPQTGQIYICTKGNSKHGSTKGKHYVYDSGDLKSFTKRSVTIFSNGDDMLKQSGAFRLADVCPFCMLLIKPEHDGVECAAKWDARVKRYCMDCNADLHKDGTCPVCS